MNLKFQGNQVTYFFKLNQKFFFYSVSQVHFSDHNCNSQNYLLNLNIIYLVHILKQILILDKLKMLWYIHVQISAMNC